VFAKKFATSTAVVRFGIVDGERGSFHAALIVLVLYTTWNFSLAARS
jgi:hypothetical protein